MIFSSRALMVIISIPWSPYVVLKEVDRYRMTKKDADELKKFREAYIVHGEYNTDEPISLTLEEWRPIYYRTHHGDNKEWRAHEKSRYIIDEYTHSWRQKCGRTKEAKRISIRELNLNSHYTGCRICGQLKELPRCQS